MRTTLRSALALIALQVLCVSQAADGRQAAYVLVRAGDDLQAAIDRARPGDVILLQAGATFVGNFRLPPTSGDAGITIRSAVPPLVLPRDRRVRPQHAAWMATLRSGNTRPALSTQAGARNWRIQWIAFDANAGGIGDIITLGSGGSDQPDPALIPRDLTLDGLIIRGDPTLGQKRGIALNSASTTIRNCDIRDIKAVGQDSQAIAGWNGPGPFVIENNHLEAAGENVMFGGADPTIPGLVPSDITIRDNYLTKPLAWRERGTPWTVKNLLELKNAQRVLIENNILEHSWLAGQTGFAILFSVTNQDGRAPWSVVSDVTLQYNIIRRAASGISLSGHDYRTGSRQARRIRIVHNLFYDISRRWGSGGRFLQIGNEPADLVVDHNTVVHDGHVLLMYGRRNGRLEAVQGFQFTNNLTVHNEYGIFGEEAGIGTPAVAAYMLGEVRRNVVAGAPASRYPPDNFYPAVDEFFGQFVSPARGNYRLRPGSRFRTAATDGTMIGADIDAIMRRVARARTGSAEP
ncbi:MAG TPA: right-handed parallel beta-helix repeat-containing protein [Vicinamibacterales bacterium]|nr:right-handed parallel beta-helix repeat-containing protein [Vicinamibacterales bacterium]